MFISSSRYHIHPDPALSRITPVPPGWETNFVQDHFSSLTLIQYIFEYIILNTLLVWAPVAKIVWLRGYFSFKRKIGGSIKYLTKNLHTLRDGSDEFSEDFQRWEGHFQSKKLCCCVFFIFFYFGGQLPLKVKPRGENVYSLIVELFHNLDVYMKL